MSMLLHTRDDMLSLLEQDLVDKAENAFAAAGVESSVHGVFSLDHLESLQESDLSQRIGVGIAYSGAGDLEIDFNSNKSPAAARGTAVKMLSYAFLLVLAVPTGAECSERYNATQLLTILRRRIHGSGASGDITNRCWNFGGEKPDTGQSTATMLYYVQVWRISLPLAGPTET